MPAPVELGQLTLGACVPIGVTAVGVADATLAVTLPDAEAKLAGALESQALFTLNPPSVEATIALLQAAIASLQASPPDATLNLVVIAQVVAELQGFVGSLQAQAGVSAGISATFATPGVWAYAHTGTPGGFGQDFTAEIGGGLPDSLDPDLPTYALVFIASDAGAISAMQTVFAG
jgi:hypothetical protein